MADAPQILRIDSCALGIATNADIPQKCRPETLHGERQSHYFF